MVKSVPDSQLLGVVTYARLRFRKLLCILKAVESCSERGDGDGKGI